LPTLKFIATVKRKRIIRNPLRWAVIGGLAFAVGSVWSVTVDKHVQKDIALFSKPVDAPRDHKPDIVLLSTVTFITTTGASNWTVPTDWDNATNQIEVIGGGGGGARPGTAS